MESKVKMGKGEVKRKDVMALKVAPKVAPKIPKIPKIPKMILKMILK